MEFVFGGDVSFWQDNNTTSQMPNFQMAYDNGWKFCYHKASQGNFIDSDFKTNWANSRKTPLKLGAYHFLQWDIDPVIQAEFFWNVVKNDPGELPLICDFEWWNTIPSNAFDILYRFLERLKQLCNGHRIGIYTAESFWKQYGKTDSYWAQYDLWTAHYDSTPPQPYAPWSEVFMWQFTGNGDGHKYGMESAGVDLNYANGDWWNKYIGNSGDVMTDYSKDAIGYLTKVEGWTNPSFDFIVGYAGGNWTKRTDGTMVYEPNEHLKPIEIQARLEKKAFFVLWDFDVDYYSRNQYMADDQHWPPESNDYPLKALESALAARDFDGLIIRVMNRYNYDGKSELMSYVSYAAHKFIERANRWLYSTKGLKKQTLIMTCDPWIQQDGDAQAQYFYAWIKADFPPVTTEQAAVTLVSSYPSGTEVPKGIADTTWKIWYYNWAGHTNNYATEPKFYSRNSGLLIYNGNHDALYNWLQISNTDTTAPSVPTNLQLSLVNNSSIQLLWVAATDNTGVVGYKIKKNGVDLAYTTTLTYSDPSVVWNSIVTYEVKAVDAAGNISLGTIAQITLPVEPTPVPTDYMTKTEFSTWVKNDFTPLEASVAELRISLENLQKDIQELKSLLTQWIN